ncbi:MAG: TonB-dependent receptor, partial [Bdellovibrionaceae bacterium]|nr:TonB-dependent receptor [Pseudobdellovibrionaceae bacterium]
MTKLFAVHFISLLLLIEAKTAKAENISSSGLTTEEDIVVKAPKIKGSLNELLQLRKKDLQVSEGLSAEQMKVTGDSDSAQTLRRVTGLTLMNGKYIYVRGLGERYSSVLLNDLSIPSPEPSRRIIPLDLFPVSLLDSVQVKKSYSTDLPAEFGGGTILLKTKSLPRERVLQIKLGMQNATSKEGFFPQGAQNDFLGHDSGYRAMPVILKSQIDNQKKIIEKVPGFSEDGFTKEELSSFGHALKNNYNLYPRKLNNNIPSLQLSYGDIWKTESLSFGTLHSLQYSNNYDAKTTLVKKFNAQNDTDLVLDESGQINSYENNIKTSYNADFGIKFSENKLNFNYLNLLDTSHEVAIKNYSVVGDSVDARRKSSSEWAERNLERKQLQGEHPLFTGLTIDWKLQSSEAKRTAPDYKEVTYLKRSTQFELNTDTTGNRRQYDYLNDHTEEQSLALESKWLNQKTKIGLLVSQRKRISDTYRFHFKNKTNDTNQMDLTKDFDTLLNEEKKLNGFELMSITDSADSYQGEQNLSSRFIWHEVDWSDKVQFGLGLREENNLTQVQTFYYYDRNNPLSSSQVKTKDLLPAANISYSFNENLKARLAFSKTLARPDFRELSTAPFIDPDSGFETIGNPFLKTTVIENWDHRYEYYWKTDEYISLGYFLKKFTHPIESQFEPSPNLRKTFANSKTATNHGVEFETRNNLRSLTRD